MFYQVPLRQRLFASYCHCPIERVHSIQRSVHERHVLLRLQWIHFLLLLLLTFPQEPPVGQRVSSRRGSRIPCVWQRSTSLRRAPRWPAASKDHRQPISMRSRDAKVCLWFIRIIFIHSFIHIEHLYSASSRKLLRICLVEVRAVGGLFQKGGGVEYVNTYMQEIFIMY